MKPGHEVRCVVILEPLSEYGACRVDACRAIQHAFSNPSLVKLISKDTWYSINQFTHCFTLQTTDNDFIFDFCVDSV